MERLCFFIIIGVFLFDSCTPSKEELITTKNRCYDQCMATLQQRKIYKTVHRSFSDTFAMIVASRKRPSLLREKIDDAIFFSRDSSKCLMIVLEQEVDEIGSFGSARIYEGALVNQTWIFSESIWFAFDRDYLEIFDTNSFENISLLARYSVMTEGNIGTSGCSIDDEFWFYSLEE
jgi:hypothetical protein